MRDEHGKGALAKAKGRTTPAISGREWNVGEIDGGGKNEEREVRKRDTGTRREKGGVERKDKKQGMGTRDEGMVGNG